MKVALFIPCLVDQSAPETAHAMVKVLKKLGVKHHFDNRQTCCGQAVFNMGFRKEATELAVKFLRLFAKSEAIVAPSGSCVSMVKNHYDELDLPAGVRQIWLDIRNNIFEFSSFLVQHLSITDVGAVFHHSAVIHNSCHQLRDLGDCNSALLLLQNVKGLNLLKGDWRDECCGFGGAFSVKYPELSNFISDRRIEQLCHNKPEFIIGTDDSCLQHLSDALKRINSPTRTIHLAQVLASEE